MIQKRYLLIKKILIAGISLLVLVIIILSLTVTQSYLGEQFIRQINQKTGTSLQVHKVRINPFGKATLYKVLVLDHKMDTLIFVDKLQVNAFKLKGFLNGKADLGNVSLMNFDVYIKKYQGESKTNLNIFSDKLKPKEKKEFRLLTNSIYANKGNLRIQNFNQPEVEPFELTNLQINLKWFEIHNDSIHTQIKSISSLTSLGFDLQHISADFTYTPKQMKMKDFEFVTLHSYINGAIHFDFPKGGLKKFKELVVIDAEFENTTIGFQDLQPFIPDLSKKGLFKLSTFINGTLNDFKTTSTLLEFDGGSILGDFSFLNSFSKFPSQINLNFDQLSTSASSLNRIYVNLFAENIPEPLIRLGQFNAKGTVNITPKDTQMNVQLFSSLGSIISSIKIQNISNTNTSVYSGNIQTTAFDLGALSGNPLLGKMTAKLELAGNKIEASDAQWGGEISLLEINNYPYQNINIEGKIREQMFTGDFNVNDPNLVMNFSGALDYSSNQRNISCVSSIKNANLFSLGITQKNETETFSGDIELVARGNNIEELIGDLFIRSGVYTLEDNTFSFQNFTAQSRVNNGLRFINVNSPDVLTGILYGNFEFRDLSSLVSNAMMSPFKHYKLLNVKPGQFFDFNLNFKGKIARAFFPNLLLNDNTFVKGKLNADKEIFQIDLRAPKFSTDQYSVDNFSLKWDSQNPIYNSYVEVKSVDTSIAKANDLLLVNTFQRDTLFFRSEFKSDGDENQNNAIDFYYTLDKNQNQVFGIKNASLFLNKKRWMINKTKLTKSELIKSNKGLWSLSPIIFEQENATLKVSFDQQEKNYADIFMELSKVRFEDIISNTPFKGLISGTLDVSRQQNIFQGNSNLKMSNFSIHEVNLGHASMSMHSQEKDSGYDFELIIEDNDEKSLDISGDITYQDNKLPINFDAVFSSFPLQTLESFTKGIFDEINGTLDGKLKGKGVLNQIDWDGVLNLQSAQLSIPYLGTKYKLDDQKIKFKKNQIEINKNSITDINFDTKGELSGILTHQNFRNLTLDMTIEAAPLLVLNTTQEDNDLYYGKAFLSGKASLKGPSNALTIDVNGSTAKGTNIAIPISDDSSVSSASYIQFVDKNNKNKKENVLIEQISGLALNFDLDVTPDAEVEIVVDTNTGSTLKGNGAGNMLMEINTNGIFNVWGDFIALEGLYNFKSLGIIDKNFALKQGGTIVWNGDPLGAQINMQAVYAVPGGTNPALLLESSAFNRKIPTEVTINLFGDLLTPETPTFSIDFPNTSGTVQTELNYRLADEERRQLQAISLLSQGVFISEVSLAALSTQTITNNLFQKASGLFETIFSREEDKLNVGLDFLQGDRNSASEINTRDRLGLTLTTQISDRILVNGKVGMPVGGIEETVIVGDVQIEFLLNEKGTLRAKIFNKENEFQYFGDELGYTQGMGLSYQVSFDTFKDLMKKILKN